MFGKNILIFVLTVTERLQGLNGQVGAELRLKYELLLLHLDLFTTITTKLKLALNLIKRETANGKRYRLHLKIVFTNFCINVLYE